MPAFIEECRYEWKRLGVPDSMAEEMAAELESDLAEAQADGVSAAEMLGESDPRRFAATWASERGLVPAYPPQPPQRRSWVVWLAVGIVALFFVLVFVAWIGLQTVSVSTSHAQPPTRVHAVVLPSFGGLNACQAVHKALRLGYTVRIPGHAHGYSCHAVIHAENATVKDGRRTVTLWLRPARR